MKRYLVGILFVKLLIIQSGCMSNRSFFHNKILIYNSEPSSGQITLNAGFIDFYEDTINKIDYPFSLFEQEQRLAKANKSEDTLSQKYRLPNTYPYSGVPFKFSRKKKSIYISYTFRGDFFEKKYFQILKRDSVETSSFDYLCDASSSDNWVITKFTGDTVMKIFGKKIRCWIFEEQYPYLFSPNVRTRTIYLDKKSLLPVQVNTIFYRPDSKNPSIVNAEIFKNKIDTIFNRPWNSSNKKWNYSKCWKSGYSSIERNHYPPK